MLDEGSADWLGGCAGCCWSAAASGGTGACGRCCLGRPCQAHGAVFVNGRQVHCCAMEGVAGCRRRAGRAGVGLLDWRPGWFAGALMEPCHYESTALSASSCKGALPSGRSRVSSSMGRSQQLGSSRKCRPLLPLHQARPDLHLPSTLRPPVQTPAQPRSTAPRQPRSPAACTAAAASMRAPASSTARALCLREWRLQAPPGLAAPLL